MPPARARRLQYRTRMLRADHPGGSEFEISASDARICARRGWAEDVTGGSQLPPRQRIERRASRRGAEASRPAAESGRWRRGRCLSPSERSAQPEPEETQDPYRDKTVSELRQMAVDRDIELPSGYVTHDELVKRLINGD